MLELHVWGPAFGLPSIDAHCLAAIAYLNQAVPSGKWVVIASSDPALSPTHELPALRKDGLWIGGFRNILHFIAKYSSGEWNLDIGLSNQEEADCVAFSSFLDATAKPLLDLSLYVSRENYTAVTRPVYSTIQPFPLPYLTPDAIRSAARSRTKYLGLDYFSMESEVASTSPSSSILPERLRNSKHTVSSLLAVTPESMAKIRLDALASKLFEPIEARRAKKRFLVSDTQITSLDCLALGYLSLMLIPELPQAWLATTMRGRFPRLSAWTQELRTEIFGGAVGFTDQKFCNLGDGLPWQKLCDKNILDRCPMFFSALVDGLPGLGQWIRKEKLRKHSMAQQDNNKQSWGRLGSLITTASAVVMLAATSAGFTWSLWSKIHGFDNGEVRSQDTKTENLNNFGDAGVVLGAYSQQLDTKLPSNTET